MKAVNSYLNFSDNCEEAFNFYKSVFGGEFATIMRFKDVPAEYKMDEKEDEKIMHIALPMGKEDMLMGSDTPGSMGSIMNGNNYSICISPESEKEATKLFNGLSTGGKVTMPMEKTFWGAYFGMLADKFGIQWMISYDENRQ